MFEQFSVSAIYPFLCSFLTLIIIVSLTAPRYRNALVILTIINVSPLVMTALNDGPKIFLCIFAIASLFSFFGWIGVEASETKKRYDITLKIDIIAAAINSLGGSFWLGSLPFARDYKNFLILALILATIFLATLAMYWVLNPTNLRAGKK
jgi:hypothetical protein